MEFGPRALGNRSILGDSRNPDMQKKLNLKIKYREGFRPFAPSVLAEKRKDYFDLKEDSPYMLIVALLKTQEEKKYRKIIMKCRYGKDSIVKEVIYNHNPFGFFSKNSNRSRTN